MKTADQITQQADHIWHVWINKYAHEQQDWPGSLYEFKSLIEFLKWGWKLLEQAFTNKLPTLHQQCSLSAPEPIPQNVLKCCLGVECVKCDILISLQATFHDERNRVCGSLGKYYDSVPDSEIYKRMAQTCAWHIYKTVTDGKEGFHGVDTTEGHLMDTSDRMYWNNLYASMAGGDPSTNDDVSESSRDATQEGRP